jgi:hypothetical protein
VVAIAVGSMEADLGGQTPAAREISRRGGRDGHTSGLGKMDDGADEARGRDARILVRSRG